MTLIRDIDIQNKINSNEGSIYIVKPKMHGPDETAFTDLIESICAIEHMFPPNLKSSKI